MCAGGAFRQGSTKDAGGGGHGASGAASRTVRSCARNPTLVQARWPARRALRVSGKDRRHPPTAMSLPARLPLPVLALLAGCATLSEQQCHSVDWWQLGQSDALAGAGPDHVFRHREACQRHGVVPDQHQWLQGHAQGLPAFCTGSQGYRHGSRNGDYHGQCPPDLEPAFLAGLHLGQELHETDQRIAEQDREIERLRRAMRADDATETSRRIDDRWLDHHKRERDRLNQRKLPHPVDTP